MLNKRKIIDLIQILDTNHIQVREAILIEEDDVVISKTFHRYVLAPGDDVTTQEARIQAIANIIWTPDVVEAYKNSPKPVIS
jgi:GR25 family glycosyltransferase involved in LPS biosynthesis